MNKILYTICIGSAALAVAASGATLRTESSGVVAKKRGSAKATTAVTATTNKRSATVRTGTRAGARHSVSNQNFRQHNAMKATTAKSNASVNRTNHLRTHRARTSGQSNMVARNNRVHAKSTLAANQNRVGNHENRVNRVNRVNRANNVELNRNHNVSVNRDRNFRHNRTRNVNVTVNNNWRGSHFAGARYAAFRNYHRAYHNRSWWHNHYSRIVFVGGGWWAWNAGYWYPAWGYDPAYTYYPYDGPIYTGQAVLGPDQVVVTVQSQLQRDGYYDGPIDGQLGPMTRQAIANFQADNGLAITSSIDEPTLDTLGVA